MPRLLTAVSAPQADEVGKMKMKLRRLVFDEQVRGARRKAGGSLIETPGTGALKPWGEIVTPRRRGERPLPAGRVRGRTARVGRDAGRIAEEVITHLA